MKYISENKIKIKVVFFKLFIKSNNSIKNEL